jgi:hypothetical protein
LFRLETSGVALVCLSYLDATNGAHIRYAVRRIKRKAPQAIILVGCWSLADNNERIKELREATHAELFCSSFRETVRYCVDAAKENETSIPTSNDEMVRLG